MSQEERVSAILKRVRERGHFIGHLRHGITLVIMCLSFTDGTSTIRVNYRRGKQNIVEHQVDHMLQLRVYLQKIGGS